MRSGFLSWARPGTSGVTLSRGDARIPTEYTLFKHDCLAMHATSCRTFPILLVQRSVCTTSELTIDQEAHIQQLWQPGRLVFLAGTGRLAQRVRILAATRQPGAYKCDPPPEGCPAVVEPVFTSPCSSSTFLPDRNRFHGEPQVELMQAAPRIVDSLASRINHSAPGSSLSSF